jgi:hypothetical protein
VLVTEAWFLGDVLETDPSLRGPQHKKRKQTYI